MLTFIGDYPCRMDAKGRVAIPSCFRKLLLTASQDRFVVRKNIYEKCLDLYTLEEWERQLEVVRERVNPYNRKHASLLREFYRGTVELHIDGNGRILIPRRLVEYANLERDLVCAGQDRKIEIWSAEEYEKGALEEDDMMTLVNDVLGESEEI